MAKPGRPRIFDRDQALRQAQRLFWAAGYEGVTLSELQEAMGGITAPSFYNAFGSKEALFREVVELHGKTEGTAPARAMTCNVAAREAIEGMLRAAVKGFSQPNKPRGCLLLSGAMNGAPDSRRVQDYLRDLRAQRRKIIRRRLQRGVAAGDLSTGTDIAALTSFYTAVLDGLALQARDGASRKTMMAAVDCAMAAWDNLVPGG